MQKVLNPITNNYSTCQRTHNVCGRELIYGITCQTNWKYQKTNILYCFFTDRQTAKYIIVFKISCNKNWKYFQLYNFFESCHLFLSSSRFCVFKLNVLRLLCNKKAFTAYGCYTHNRKQYTIYLHYVLSTIDISFCGYWWM